MNKSSKKIKRRFEKKFYIQFFIVQANEMLTTVKKKQDNAFTVYSMLQNITTSKY